MCTDPPYPYMGGGHLSKHPNDQCTLVGVGSKLPLTLFCADVRAFLVTRNNDAGHAKEHPPYACSSDVPSHDDDPDELHHHQPHRRTKTRTSASTNFAPTTPTSPFTTAFAFVFANTSTSTNTSTMSAIIATMATSRDVPNETVGG